MSLLAMSSRIGWFGAVSGVALGLATLTSAAKPADAHVSVWLGFGAPAYAYDPPAYGYPPAYTPPASVYDYAYGYTYPGVGVYVGSGGYGWHGQRWRDRDDWDDDDGD